MSLTMTRTMANVLTAGALALAVVCSVGPSFARGGGGGGGGGAGPVIPSDGGGAHSGGGGGFASRSEPSRKYSSGGDYAARGSYGTNGNGSNVIRPGRGNESGGYAYGHRRYYGNGGSYYGADGYDGWNFGYNAYCTPYWLSVNPNLCYNGS